MFFLRPRSVLLVLLTLGLAQCGGAKKEPASPREKPAVTDAEIDSDALALIPSAPVLVMSVDVHAFFESRSVGVELTRLAEGLLPTELRGSISLSKDVDHAIVAAYTLSGANVVGVLNGRFNPEKMMLAARAHARTAGANGTSTAGQADRSSAATLIESSYAGRSLFTINNVGFTVLTTKTALVGDETGIRRVLDRIQDGNLVRSESPWMLETLENRGADVTAVADIADQPIASIGVQQLGAYPGVRGLKTVRALGKFKPPFINVAGSLTYGSEADANSAADTLKRSVTTVNALAILGIAPRIDNADIQTRQANLQVKGDIDEAGLRKALGRLGLF